MDLHHPLSILIIFSVRNVIHHYPKNSRFSKKHPPNIGGAVLKCPENPLQGKAAVQAAYLSID